MINLYTEPMAAYYNSTPNDPRFKLVLALWQSAFRAEGMEVGYLTGTPSTNSMEEGRDCNGWLACSPAEQELFRKIFDNLDMMAERLMAEENLQ